MILITIAGNRAFYSRMRNNFTIAILFYAIYGIIGHNVHYAIWLNWHIMEYGSDPYVGLTPKKTWPSYIRLKHIFAKNERFVEQKASSDLYSSIKSSHISRTYSAQNLP